MLFVKRIDRDTAPGFNNDMLHAASLQLLDIDPLLILGNIDHNHTTLHANLPEQK